MENLRNRVNVKLLTSAKKARKLARKPTLDSWVRFSPDVVGVKLKKEELTLDRPIYSGFSVLDLSKTLTFWWHYDVMLPKYGPENLQLLFTDTDR